MPIAAPVAVSDHPLTRLTLPIGAIIIVAFGTMSTVAYVMGVRLGIDFGVFWRTANGPFSEAYRWDQLYMFPYAPTMLLWIKPLAMTSFATAFAAFTVLSVLLFVLAARPLISTTAILLCFCSHPVVAGLLTGQVTLLLTALLLFACRMDNRWLAGLLFGVIASVKPHLVIMAPLVMLLMRDWRALGASVIAFLSIVGVSILQFGASTWMEWLQSLDRFHTAVIGSHVTTLTITPALVGERLGLPWIPIYIASVLAGALLALLGRKQNALDRATLIGISSLLAAPYALRYDFAVAMPFIALALTRRNVTALLATIPLYPLPLMVTALNLLWPKDTADAVAETRGPRHA